MRAAVWQVTYELLFLEEQFEWTNFGVNSTVILKIELQRVFLSGYASTEGASDEILAIYGHDLQQVMKFWLFMRDDKQFDDMTDE